MKTMARKPPTRSRGGSRKAAKPLPSCRAILVCEKVIKDAWFGTVTLVGIITRLTAAQFPATTSPLFVFAQLAHGIGSYDLTIEIQDDMQGTVMGRSSILPIGFQNRTDVQDIIVRIPPFSLLHAGGYTVAVLVNGNEIGRQTFDTPEVRSGNDDNAQLS